MYLFVILLGIPAVYFVIKYGNIFIAWFIEKYFPDHPLVGWFLVFIILLLFVVITN